jgi:hypothetical protein
MTITTRLTRMSVAALLIGAAAGCSDRVDAEVEDVPIGTPVEVTREDGGVVRGTLTARDEGHVRMGEGPAARSIPREEITSVEVVEGTAPPELSPAARFREFRVPEGTVIPLRLDTAVGSDTSSVSDDVEASVTDAVMIDGVDVLPVGSVVRGVVTTAEPSGKVRGRANLAVRFRSVSIAGRDDSYALMAGLQQTAAADTTSDAKTIGIPAAGGAIIGAIIGGKKGAGVGAAVGGGVGTAVVLSTTGADIHLPRGTAFSIAIEDAIDVRIPIGR